MQPDISVILVTYNSEPVIDKFFQSLDDTVKSLECTIETIVTDNASRDRSRERISLAEKKFKRLNIVKRFNQENVGLSSALNEMIGHSRGRRILVCNPDVEFTTSIQEMLEVSKQHPDFVLVPELFYPDGTLQRVMYKRFPTVLRIVADFTNIGRSLPKFFDHIRRDFNYTEKEFKFPMDTLEQVAPVCMLVCRDVAEKFRPFYDPVFPVYWNDVDMSKRAEVLQIPRAIVPNARVFHGHGKSVRGMVRERQFMLFYSSRGLIGYARRWGMYPNILRLLLFIDSVFSLMKEIPARIIGRRTRNLAKAHKLYSFREVTRSYLLPFRCSLN